MNLARDPECMTVQERRQAVAAILATAVLRLRHLTRYLTSAGTSSPESLLVENTQISLDLSSETRLSVAQRPAG